MRRFTLALWAVPCVVFAALGGAGFAAIGPEPLGVGIMSAGLVFPLLILLVVARRADKKTLAAYRSLGEATGCALDDKLNESGLVKAIIAGLCQRIERGARYKSVFMTLRVPCLVVDGDGEILFANEAMCALDPQLSAGGNLFAFDSQFDGDATALLQPVMLDGRPFIPQTADAGEGRTVYGFVDCTESMPTAQLHKFMDAVVTDAAAFRFSHQETMDYPGLAKLNECLDVLTSGLDDLDDLSGAAARIEGGFSARTGQIRQVVSELEAAREAESEKRGRLEAKLGEIARLIDLYRATADRIGDMAAQAHQESIALKQTFEDGQAGAANLDRLSASIVQNIDQAASAAQRTSTAITELARLTAQIDKMTGEIEDVSFRTNLLALNAAVEAARAGEKGAGFAVVADEVRTLAQVSAKSAKQIRALAANGKEQSDEGQAGADGLNDMITEIDEHLQKIRGEARSITDTFAAGGEKWGRLEQGVGLLAETAASSVGGRGAEPQLVVSKGVDSANGTR